MLSSYQKHWLSYQQGAKFLHNLFAYFNRVSLRKSAVPDNSLEVILGSKTATPTSQDDPLEIRNVSHTPLTEYSRTVLVNYFFNHVL